MSTHDWVGRVFFGEDLLLYAGALGATTRHSHHTLQIVVAEAGKVWVADGRGRVGSARCFVIPARAPHAITAASGRAIVVHVALERPQARALRGLSVAGSVDTWRRAGSAYRGRVTLPTTWGDAVRVAGDILGTLAPREPPAPVHPAVTRTLKRLPGLLDGRISLGALASHVGLSPSRLSHVFSAEVGSPLRAYVRWLRLRRAAALFSRGVSMTDAAHAAGFTDAAHMSNTFRRTFGVSPTGLTAGVQWVVSDAAGPYKRR